MTRRELLALPLAMPLLRSAAQTPKVALFSKPYDDLSTPELGRAVRKAGLDAIDLTVRTHGHIAPERVEELLPRAIETFRAMDVSVPMISTDITTADAQARRVLTTAVKAGVTHFKIGYWRYKDEAVAPVLARVREQARGIAELARECGIVAGWHNHSGGDVGGAIWDTQMLIQDLDPKWIGFFFDPSHAAGEGAVSGWNVSLRVALPRLKMLAAKDHKWTQKGRTWKRATCPLGQGVVDLDRVFAMAAAAGFAGPVSLQVEYDPEDLPAAIAKDAEFTKNLVSKHFRKV